VQLHLKLVGKILNKNYWIIVDKIMEINYYIKMVNINEGKLEDINLLTEMNKQLFEDEKAENAMDIFQSLGV
jgi:hypothetical protein